MSISESKSFVLIPKVKISPPTPMIDSILDVLGLYIGVSCLKKCITYTIDGCTCITERIYYLNEFTDSWTVGF